MAGYSSYHSTGHSDREGDFQRLTQVIATNIQKISQNVHSMRMMVNQLGSPQDTENLRSELNKLQQYTLQYAKDTNLYMKDLQALPMPSNAADQRQWKMQKERLTKEFSTALNDYQKIQKQSENNQKDLVARTRAESGMKSRGISYHDDDHRRNDQLIQLESPVQSQTAIQLEEEANLEMLREREAAIHQIENDIVEVNQIFKDLALMVHEQGGMIDSIEANIENASIHVGQGTQQLTKARDYQTASRRKLCIIVVIAVIVLAVIITIIVLTVKK